MRASNLLVENVKISKRVQKDNLGRSNRTNLLIHIGYSNVLRLTFWHCCKQFKRTQTLLFDSKYRIFSMHSLVQIQFFVALLTLCNAFKRTLKILKPISLMYH